MKLSIAGTWKLKNAFEETIWMVKSQFSIMASQQDEMRNNGKCARKVHSLAQEWQEAPYPGVYPGFIQDAR